MGHIVLRVLKEIDGKNRASCEHIYRQPSPEHEVVTFDIPLFVFNPGNVLRNLVVKECQIPVANRRAQLDQKISDDDENTHHIDMLSLRIGVSVEMPRYLIDDLSDIRDKQQRLHHYELFVPGSSARYNQRRCGHADQNRLRN